MNYFSFLYQSNIIRVFPLCAGVIGAHRKSTAPVLMFFPSVAGLSESLAESLLMVYVFPLRGGYRFLFGFSIISTLCFPCVGVIGLSAIRRFIAVSVSPAYRGYLGHVAFYERTESSFPCAGLSAPQFLTDYLKNVFPLRGGYRGWMSCEITA